MGQLGVFKGKWKTKDCKHIAKPPLLHSFKRKQGDKKGNARVWTLISEMKFTPAILRH
jgi:hypothetical protein